MGKTKIVENFFAEILADSEDNRKVQLQLEAFADAI